MLLFFLVPLVLAVLLFLGKAILKHLGNPFDTSNATKWGLLFLAGVVLYQMAPQAVMAVAAAPVPSSDALALAIPLGYAVLSLYGYLHLKRDFFERAHEPERLPPRGRAAPPPPAAMPAGEETTNGQARRGGGAFRIEDVDHERP